MNAPSPSPDVGRIRFRKLRIAWSAFWSLACVLLIVLWVRSYWHVDVLQRQSTSRLFIICSSKGRLAYFENRASPQSIMPPEEIASIIGDFIRLAAKPILGFGRVRGLRIPPLCFAPYWFPVLISGVLAAVPWLRWRFNLRTLLIATTLVAIGLGTIVYSIK
jgi:hypothetical protein